MNLPNIETVAACYHESRVAQMKAAGIVAQRNAFDEELLLPYAELSIRWRTLTRETVRAVYAAIEACTIEQVRTEEG